MLVTTRMHQTLYSRGKTWGEFSAVVNLSRGATRLLVYGSRGLVETVALDLRPGQQRVFR